MVDYDSTINTLGNVAVIGIMAGVASKAIKGIPKTSTKFRAPKFKMHHHNYKLKGGFR